ncbi:MAG: YhfC family glutamic-type intramembrane protease [Anaerolineae bacterium]
MNPATVAAFIISLIIQVGFPLAVTLRFRQQFQVPWKLFAYGMLIFAVFQIVSWLPISVYLDATIGTRLTTETGAFFWLLATALVTSLFEESGRWLGYRYLFPRHKYALSWENGVMYGLGHVAMESMLLIAGLTYIYFIAYLVLGGVNQGTFLKELAPTQALEVSSALRDILNTQWTQPLFVAFERTLMVGHQVAWSLMVLASYIAKRKRWFLFALFYHWTIAVVVPGLARLSNFWIAEGVNLLLCLVSVLIIIKLRSILAEARLA